MNGATRIFLGDLVRALDAVGSARGENWDTITSLLGFARAAPSTAAGPMPGVQPVTVTPAITPGVVRPEPPASAEPVGADIGALVEFDLDRQTEPARPLPRSAGTPSEPPRKIPLALQPLLDPLWQRGILIEAVGRQLPEGDIALRAAVEAIARGEPLAQVPRENIQSVSKGCHVLIDTGSAMRPFASDARGLVVALQRAVGAKHTRVLTFIDCPTTGVLNETYDDQPYQAPDNGALVLAVSDLCAAGPRAAIRRAAPHDWLKVARMVHGAGSTLIVLNPYPRELWPAALSARLPIIYWDRTTRAADVRHARRRAR